MEPRFKPTAVKAPHGATILEITWGDGHRSLLPHEILRGYCPCATCQGHSGTLKFQTGGDQRIRELSQVGNYALSFSWGDGHDSGIYSFRYLRSLADLVETQGAEAVKSLGELPRL